MSIDATLLLGGSPILYWKLNIKSKYLYSYIRMHILYKKLQMQSFWNVKNFLSCKSWFIWLHTENATKFTTQT